MTRWEKIHFSVSHPVFVRQGIIGEGIRARLSTSRRGTPQPPGFRSPRFKRLDLGADSVTMEGRFLRDAFERFVSNTSGCLEQKKNVN
ncbi:hypothetical protein E2C01_047706 [Portunus trituberculatus]|uniref:Uncharacterized protein n=1 Tax=Portunus trituberculatus TaxID=210409 RepID=A0A5B7G8L8_PORTR|nr:hypothetical protein [Portunus trituberculatus]